jgi:D-alanine-D-alanine ligase
MMANNQPLKIIVLFGGRSGEHDVSLMSAKFVISQLDPQKYDVIQVGITREGEWFTGEGILNALIAGDVTGYTPVTILPDPKRPGLYSLAEDNMQFMSDVDVVFPVLHGTFGEDGTLQGLLEMAGIAYVGPGVLGAAVGMDKAVFADVMRANNIPIVPTMLMLRSEFKENSEAMLAKCESFSSYPMFIKPANMGSSVGISKVRNRSDLYEGLMDAAQYDRRMVIQAGWKVREIEVAVMGNDKPIASVCGEVLPGEEFYSYDAKYYDETSNTVVPAEIPEQLSEKIRDLAVKAYQAIDSAGLTRVDFFLNQETGEIAINELNTIPGFTEISMYPMLWEATGVPNQELVEKLINFALSRKEDRNQTKTAYQRGA